MGSVLLVLLAVSLLEMAPLRTATAAVDTATDDRRGFQEKFQSELDDLAGKVRGLDAKAQKLGAKDRKEVNRDLKKLKNDLRAADSKLKRLKNSSSAAWDEVKKDFDSAERKAKQSYDKVAAKLH